ncbi:MAG: carboxypeptidase regulatory-like domain-containing protein [Planctomycetota bacterium]
MFRQSPEELARTETSAGGIFAIEVPPTAATDLLELTVSKSGFLPRKNETPRLRAAGAGAATGPELTLLVPGIPVEGQVLLPDGAPASSGWIHTLDRCVGSGGGLGFKELAPIPIGEDGRFSAAVTGARVAFQASVPGFAPAFSDFVYPSSAATAQVTIQVREGRTVQVTVVDTSGEPVSGAAVRYKPWLTVMEGPDAFFRHYRAEEGWQGKTDASGRCIFYGVPRVSGHFFADHPEFKASMRRLTGSRGDEIQIMMAPARWLVVRLPDDAPAEVTIAGPFPIGAQLTRQEELHRSQALPPTPGAAMLSMPGYLPHRVRWPGGTGEHDLGELQLDRGLTLCVKVRDAAGSPLPGVTVTGRRGEDEDQVPLMLIPGRSGKTDHKGEVRISGLLPGPCDLKATAARYLTRTMTHRLELDGETVEMRLERAGALALSVFGNDGLPVGDASITLSTGEDDVAHAATAPDGSVRCAPVPPGVPLELTIAARGSLERIIPLPPLEPGETRNLGEIHLERGAVVQGQVRDQFGELLPGADVDFDRKRETTTDNRGAFEVTGLAAGEHRLHVSHSDCFEERTLRVDLGHDQVRMMTIELERGGEYEARVLYYDGEPVRGAQIDLNDGHSLWRRGHMTDASGRFRVRGIAPGPVMVHVSRGQLSTTISANGGRGLPARVLLARGASLEIEARTEDGLPVPDLLSILARTTGVDDSWGRLEGIWDRESPGRVLITHLVPRVIEATVRAPGFHPAEAQRVDLRGGRVSTLKVILRALPPQQLIEILVRTSEGGPLPGARVQRFEFFADVTGPDGIVEILHSPGDSIEELYIEKDGYAPKELEGALSNARNGRVVVTLDPVAALVVTLQGADGPPAVGRELSLQIYEVSDPENEKSSWQPTDGVHHFESLSPGSYVIQVLEIKRVIAEEQVTVLPGEKREMTITLPPTFEVTGRVTVDGAPATGGRIGLSAMPYGLMKSCSVDADGHFQVALRAPGPHRIMYYRLETGGRYALPPRMIERGDVLELKITTSILEGIVRDADGSPLPGLSVHLDGRRSAEFTTDPAGHFSVEGIVPGAYRWKLENPPTRLFPHGVIQVGAEDEVEIIVLSSGEVTLVMPEELWGEAWSASLLQAEGHEISLLHVTDRPQATVHLPLGEQWIKASAGEWWLARQRVRVSGGVQRIPLHFQQAGRIRIVRDLEESPELWEAQLRVERVGDAGDVIDSTLHTDWGARIKAFPALPGSYSVRAILPDGRAFEKSGMVEREKVLEIRLP